MDLAEMPTEILRELCDAFRIKIRFDREGQRAHFTAEVPAESIGHLQDMIARSAQICDVHPTCQNANPQVLIEGLPLAVTGAHAKQRRSGYFKSTSVLRA
jgi:hypothetical protein